MTDPALPGPRRRSVPYLIVRALLFLWGGLVVAVAATGLLLRDPFASEPELRPLEVGDLLVAAGVLAMGFLLCLPFGWLARHTLVRTLLQAATVVLIVARTFAMASGPPLETLVVVTVIACPPLVASWLIARERRRQRVDYAAIF